MLCFKRKGEWSYSTKFFLRWCRLCNYAIHSCPTHTFVLSLSLSSDINGKAVALWGSSLQFSLSVWITVFENMKLVYVCCSLLIAVWQEVEASGSGPSGVLDRVSGGSSCSQVRLKPAGQCEDDEECPYQITVPPLTIQLPKQFRLLEKTMKELQSLKETVNRLKSSCLECSSQQVDLNLQKDSGDPPTNSAEQSRGDTSTRVYRNGNNSDNDIVQHMQVKMNRMSISLKNARSQINSLQGRLEELNLLDLQNVEDIVDRKVENITGIVNKISSTCTNCPGQQQQQLQRKLN